MKDKVILVVSILLGLMMLNSGLNKFFAYMPLPEMTNESMVVMGSFIATGWLMPLVAIAEIVGGICLAIPKTRALGAIILFPIMIGIVLLHVFQDPGTLIMPLIFFVMLLGIIIDNKEKYLPMISGK